MKKIFLKIEGMHCSGCSNRLEKILTNTNGIENVKISLENKKAEIEFNELIITLKNILEIIVDSGFEGEQII